MDFPLTIEDQAGFDALVKERIARERAKYADHADIKSELADLRQKRDEADKGVADAVARAEKAEAELAEMRAAKQLDTWRAEVAAEAKVPADVLRGATREELAEHAAALASHMHSSAPPIQSPGRQPEGAAQPAEIAAVRSLFGAPD